MQKSKFFPLILLVLGICGGIVRTFELRYVYDKTTALAAPNAPLTLALWGLSFLAVVLAIVFTVRVRPVPIPDGAKRVRIPMVIGSFLLGASAVMDTVTAMDVQHTLTQFILAGLGFLTAAVLVLMINGSYEKLTLGLFATVAVFWSAFYLLTVFAKHGGNPILGEFVFEFFAVLFIVLSFYFYAGAYFGQQRTKILLICIGLASYFSAVAVIGPTLAYLLFPSDALQGTITLSSGLRLVFACLYVTCMPTLFGAVTAMPETATTQTVLEDAE